MRNLNGALPVRMGDYPVYLCSSHSLLKDTHSVFVSDYKEKRNGSGGTYKIGLDLMPELHGYAQCTF